MTKEEIKARGKKRRTLPLPVEPWGGDAFICCLNAQDRLDYESLHASIDKNDSKSILRSMTDLLTRSTVDSEGKPIFDAGDIDDLLQFDIDVLQKAFDLCLQVNGMRKDAVEQAAKNSESGPGAALSSSSPEPSSTATPTILPAA